MNIREFTNLVILSFGEKSVNFLYYFFSPENLLISKLAFSDIDAIASRIDALKNSINRFGYKNVVTQNVFDDEIRQLFSAICYKKISSSQFDIPWAKFRSIVIAEEHESYDAARDAYLLNSIELPDTVIGARLTKHVYIFPNGRVENYIFPLRIWSFASIILESISAFMKNPVFGIESILSTRIRHNILVREFENSLDEILISSIPGLLSIPKNELFHKYKEPLIYVVSEFVDHRLHSKRPSKPDGLFELVPTQEELATLVTEALTCDTHELIMDCVINWLKFRLIKSLAQTQMALQDGLLADLKKVASELQERLKDDGVVRLHDNKRIAAAMVGKFERTLDEVVHWFDWPETPTERKMTLAEVMHAVDGRFEHEIEAGRLRPRLTANFDQVAISDENVRPIFDIGSEIYFNALKHSNVSKVLLRASRKIVDDVDVIIFSNRVDWVSPPLAASIGVSSLELSGNDLPSEGGSGIPKMAAACGEVADATIEIWPMHRRGYFHLLVPAIGFECGHGDE